MSPKLKRVEEKAREIVGLRVTLEEKRRIVKLAAEAGQSITEFVRAALESYVTRRGRSKNPKEKSS